MSPAITCVHDAHCRRDVAEHAFEHARFLLIDPTNTTTTTTMLFTAIHISVRILLDAERLLAACE